MILSDTLDPGKYPWPFSDRLRRLLVFHAADRAFQHALVNGDMTTKAAAELALEEAKSRLRRDRPRPCRNHTDDASARRVPLS